VSTVSEAKGDGVAVRQAISDRRWLLELGDHRASLTFALFGFDAVSSDWVFRQRVLDDHLMYLVTQGSCVGDVEGTSVALKSGSLLWMQPGMRHTFSVGASTPPLTLYWIRFRLTRARIELMLEGRVAQQWHSAWELTELLDQLLDELRAQLPYRDARIQGLLLSICAAVLRGREHERQHLSGTLNRTQRQVIEAYIHDHLAEWPTPGDLAEVVHLSPDYFSRLFTHTFGMPPRAWLVQARMRRGARLLTESVQTISEIATSLGFDDIGPFSHQFKQRFGVSPRAYRQSQS
jgi:AraC-like DNA-binding protein